MKRAFEDTPPPPGCPLCSEALTEASCQLACAHIICALCLDGLELAEETDCPICVKPFQPAATLRDKCGILPSASVLAACAGLIPRFEQVVVDAAAAASAAADIDDAGCAAFAEEVAALRAEVCTELDRVAAAHVFRIRKAGKARKKQLEAVANSAEISIGQLRAAMAVDHQPALAGMQTLVVPALPPLPSLACLDIDALPLRAATRAFAASFQPVQQLTRLCSLWDGNISAEQYAAAAGIVASAELVGELNK